MYHGLVGGDYQPFEGICLTDTFQMYEKEDMVDALLDKNSKRRKRQKQLDIRVILGNPPYSAGQTSANDNNQNVAYKHLDQRITETYAERSKAALSKGLYDSYIRAIRWASDRIGDSGVIGFATNAGFLEANTADGLRQCLPEEFANIYVFHLRGNQRTAGELSRKEGGKIFGSGSRAPIAISLLVKNPQASQHGQIRFHDIGDYLSREDKLEKISAYGSIAGITQSGGWQRIAPDQYGDWLKQRDDRFVEYIAMGDKKKGEQKLFENFSLGVSTNRDAWCYNASKAGVTANMSRMIDFYNSETARFAEAFSELDKNARGAEADKFIDTDPRKISWSVNLKQELVKNRHFDFESECLTPSLYRPFTKQWLYFNRRFNERVLQMPRIFSGGKAANRVIQINAKFQGTGQIALISNALPDLHCNGDSQCFPLYLYDEPEVAPQGGLFDAPAQPARKRRDALSDEGLAHFRAAYTGEKIGKEDVFYYVYGLLHSPDYREKYADNLAKELPRIPCVKTAAGFWAFSKAGRGLAELHLNYEKVTPYPLKIESSGKLTDADYRVEKIRYGKQGKDKDRTTLIYNDKITLTGIPLEAYEYVVNGKPALDWVVERQCVKTDKDSGIVNDANDWAIETMHNPRYPLELFQRVVTVSLETMKIVRSLPSLDI